MVDSKPMRDSMESQLSAPGREDLLGRVFHGSSQGILVARMDDGRILDANHAFLFLVGRDRDDVIGATMTEIGLFTELGGERTYRLLRERGSIDGFDAQVPTPAGETRILRLWAEAIPTKEGLIAVVRASDIDGRAAAGARYFELREAEVRYRALVEQVPAIIYTEVADESSPTGSRATYVSPQAQALLGYSQAELLEDPSLWVSMIHAEDRDRIGRAALRRPEAGGPIAHEYRIHTRDGATRWYRDEAILIEDPATGIRFWQGLMLDITEQRLAQERQVETEAKYRALVEQIPAIVYLGEYGENGAWLYISPQVEQVLGYTPREWLEHPHPMTSFTHPDDLGAAREAEAQAQRQAGVYRAEYRMQAKDGRWVWILDEAATVRNRRGEPLFMQGVMYDVTERKRAEQELASANERLRALDRLKNTLLHTLSHDLKAPLTAILGAASTLERLDRELPEEDRRSLLRTLATRTVAMNALLTDLLDLDRLDQGIVEPRRFPVDLADVVRGLATSQVLGGREVSVTAERIILAVDRPKVERMMENLLANAARHTPPTCRIWVSVEEVEDGVVLKVEDDGPGVPDELKEAIFESFRRGPEASGLPGTGIGLSLVARFAELHGGRAWVEDREGGGASFRVFLPDVTPDIS